LAHLSREHREPRAARALRLPRRGRLRAARQARRAVARLRHRGAAPAGRQDAVTRPTVLFVCTHNSARSQMAEGLLRALGGERFEAASAGTEKTSVNRLAIRAMAERGIDISAHASKTVDGLLGQRWDYLVTVCDDA